MLFRSQGRPVWATIQQRLRPLWTQLEIGAQGVQRLLWGGLVAVMIVVTAAGVWSLRKNGREMRADSVVFDPDLPVYYTLPDFQLLERSGRAFGLSDLRRKVWVANLFFAHCTDTCPLETAEMAKLQAEFAGEPEFRLVSISVDPERDTPQVLARYADQNGADSGRWLFLTGHKETIFRLAREGFKLSVEDAPTERTAPREPAYEPRQGEHRGRPEPAKRGADRSNPQGKVLRDMLGPTIVWAHHVEAEGPIHSARFVLVDRQARIRGYFASGDAEALQGLRQAITRVLQERQ